MKEILFFKAILAHLRYDIESVVRSVRSASQTFKSHAKKHPNSGQAFVPRPALCANIQVTPRVETRLTLPGG